MNLSFQQCFPKIGSAGYCPRTKGINKGFERFVPHPSVGVVRFLCEHVLRFSPLTFGEFFPKVRKNCTSYSWFGRETAHLYAGVGSLRVLGLRPTSIPTRQRDLVITIQIAQTHERAPMQELEHQSLETNTPLIRSKESS